MGASVITARRQATSALLPMLGTGALLVLFSALSPYFLDPINLQNLVNDASTLLLCAFGMTLVILVGEIDLSVGAVCSLLTIVFASLLTMGLVWPLAALIVMMVGLGISAINGVVSVIGGVPSFIVTLGTMSIATGASYLLTGSIALPITDEGFFSALYFGTFLGLPVTSYLVAGALLAVLVFQTRSALGREFVAVGMNPEAAR
ncbi:ABC transporter permease, partial [Salinibacterium sp.]|uniref:ABC transporter permease n=1 Tax=Salinibacterium sp. TaxID=1915057 RepID=UPI00286B24FC